MPRPAAPRSSRAMWLLLHAAAAAGHDDEHAHGHRAEVDRAKDGLLRALDAPVRLGRRSLTISASVGVVADGANVVAVPPPISITAMVST